MFSARAAWDLTPSALAKRVAAARTDGGALCDLTNANAASVPLPGEILREALAQIARSPEALRYEPDPRGDRAAREAIAAYHSEQGASVEPDHVVLTAGTSEGYAQLFRVLADPGDCVHLPTPGYPLFDHLAELEGLRSAHYPLCPPRAREEHWAIDLDRLASTLAPESRLLVAIHPHNPTGSLVTADELASLRSLCSERSLALLSDEVFADSAPASSARSLLAEAGDGPLCCVLSGASKVLGVPQLKVAWIAVGGPPLLRDAALARLEFAADAFLSVSPLVARAIPALFAQRAQIRRALNERVARNRAALERALRGNAVARAIPSEAGWAAILRVRGGAATPLADEALAIGALEEARVLVHPGSLFELAAEQGTAHLVASLLAPESEFAAGAAALAAWLAARLGGAAR